MGTFSDFLYFDKTEDNYLTFDMSGGIPQKKDFWNGQYDVDLAYYLNLNLYLCQDFAILKIEAGTL